eukprot:jgi/Tetstr1/434069/TSEL_023213.t1
MISPPVNPALQQHSLLRHFQNLSSASFPRPAPAAMAALSMAATSSAASLRPPSSAQLFGTRHKAQPPRQRLTAVRPLAAVNKNRVPGVSLMMTPRPYMLDANDTIEDAATLFLKRGFSHAPVVDSNGTLIGILSETDILFTNGGDGLTSIYSEDLDQQKVNAKVASEAMTAAVITVTPTTRFDEAAHIMLSKKIHCLPVVDEENRVLGIITRKDILRYNWRKLPFLSN